MGANSQHTAAGAAAKTALVTTQKVVITASIAAFGTVNGVVEVGRGAPDTSLMQGTTARFTPDRWLLAD